MPARKIDSARTGTTPPDWTDMLRVFGRIGLLSFGGPAAQIGLMHRELVEERPWLDEQTYLRALSLCMLLPGPEAMQLATYAGWRLRGVAGGLLAGGLFFLPGALVIALLALAYAAWGQVPLVQAAFAGIKAAVIVVVVQALIRIARKALPDPVSRVIAALAFVALFVLGLPFPAVILAAAAWGALRAAQAATDLPPVPDWRGPLRVAALWGTLWLAPLAALSLFGPPFLAQIGWLFAKLAVVSFGGAYAVLAYLTQTMTEGYGWLTTAQMIDALGLAETTPGPLILVTQFAAMVAGHGIGGAALALAAGALTLWATFVPCFLWIFLTGPMLDQINARPRLGAALTAITAAIVGVIASLSLWFALHVLFADVRTGAWGGLALPLPDLASLQPQAAVLVVLACVLMLGLKAGVMTALAVLAVAGIVLGWLWG